MDVRRLGDTGWWTEGWETETGLVYQQLLDLIAETMEDVFELKKALDYDTHLPEWVTRIGNSGFLSALFIFTDNTPLTFP